MCPDHAEKSCEIFCEKCETPVCSTCVTSGKHKGHDISEVPERLILEKERLKKDLKELETTIYPRYEEIASNVQAERASLQTYYRKLSTSADQQGQLLHREITAIVNQRKYEIAEMRNRHLAIFDDYADEIMQRIADLRQIILDLKIVLDSNDFSSSSTYKSRNAEFKRLPRKVRATLPAFCPQKISTKHLHEVFGILTPLSINTTEQDKTMTSPEAVSSVPVKPLLDEPRVTATMKTGYTYLYSVSCVSDEGVWTRGNNNIMKLIDLNGKLMSSIQTKSSNEPWDIAVTRDGDLLYTDYYDKTVNLVKNKQIETAISLQGWEPLFLCCTSSDDLLVTMTSDDATQAKVVRYSGSRKNTKYSV
jgi:hypothetical protein